MATREGHETVLSQPKVLVAFEPDRGFIDIASEARADVLRCASHSGG